MTRELIGLNRYLYTFNLNEYEQYQKALEREKKKGKITVLFINNKYGFESKRINKI